MTTRATHQPPAAYHSVLAMAQRALALIEVTGPDRAIWLNGLVSCDVMKCEPRRAAYGLILQRTGRIMADAVVVRDDAQKSLLVAVPASLADELMVHLERYLVMEDAEIRVTKDGFTAWALHGPQSVDVAENLRGVGAVGGSLDRTGLGGAFLLAREPAGAGVRIELERRLGVTGGAVGDDSDWEPLRVDRNVASFGVDFDGSTYPQEASLETSAVSFDKGCYLGQEVVCMLERRGHVKRKLVRVVVDGSPPPSRGTPVLAMAGVESGAVMSSAVSPMDGRSVALAMVRRAHAEVGTPLFIGGASATVEAPSTIKSGAE